MMKNVTAKPTNEESLVTPSGTLMTLQEINDAFSSDITSSLSENITLSTDPATLVVDEEFVDELSSNIGQWITHYGKENITPDAQKKFLMFWEKLCVLETVAFNFFKKKPDEQTQKDYYQLLNSRRQIHAQQQLWQEMQTNLMTDDENLRQLTFIRIKQAININVNEIPTNLAEKISYYQNKIAPVVKQVHQTVALADKKLNTFYRRFDHHYGWSATDRTFLQQYLTIDCYYSYSETQAKTLLDELAQRLFTDPNLPFYYRKNWDELLGRVLAQWSLVTDLKKVSSQTYWQAILKGLLKLGANPIPWLDKQLVTPIPDVEDEDVDKTIFFLCSQTELIVFFLEYQSPYAGENNIYLSDAWKKLVAALNQFGQELFKCVSSDNDYHWKLLGQTIERLFNKGEPIDGSRKPRAKIWWSVIRWVMILLYDELKKDPTSGNTAVLTDNVTTATSLIDQTIRIYNDSLTVKNKLFYNDGQRSFSALTEALNVVATICDGFANARYACEISQKITGVIKSNQQENEVIRQAIEVTKQEKEVIKQERDKERQEKQEFKQGWDKERQEKEEFKQGRDKERQEKEEFKQERDKEKQEKEEIKQELDKEKQEKEEITEKSKQKDVKIAKFLAIAKNNLRADFRQSFANQPIYQANFFTSIKDDQRYKAIIAAKKVDPAYEDCFDDEQVFDEMAFEAYQSYQPS